MSNREKTGVLLLMTVLNLTFALSGQESNEKLQEKMAKEQQHKVQEQNRVLTRHGL